MTRHRSNRCNQIATVLISNILQALIIAGTACFMAFPFVTTWWKGDITNSTGSNSWEVSTFIGLYKVTTQYYIGSCNNQIFEYSTSDWATETGNDALIPVARSTVGVGLGCQILSFLIKCCPLLIRTKWGRLHAIYLGSVFMTIGFALSMVSMIYCVLMGLGGSFNVLELPNSPTNDDDEMCNNILYNSPGFPSAPATVPGNWYDMTNFQNFNTSTQSLGPAFISGWCVVALCILSLIFERFSLNYLVFFAETDEEKIQPHGDHIHLNVYPNSTKSTNYQQQQQQQQYTAPIYASTTV